MLHVPIRVWNLGVKSLIMLHKNTSSRLLTFNMHTKLLLFVFVAYTTSLMLGSAFGMVPMPQSLTYGNTNLPVSAAMKFHSSSSSAILQRALTRLHGQTFLFKSAPYPTDFSLNVSVTSDSENLQFGVDESYSLTIKQNGAHITASTIWGAMHGLQTFSQLVVFNGGNYSIPSVPIEIHDAPRFPWRGFLVDTSRHWIDVPTLKRQIEALSASKMNTLHWHAVDAETFPMSSNSEPRLSKATYEPSAKFSIQDIKNVVEYAKDRGVRVVVEFDVPGHAASWGVGIPEIVVNCPAYAHNINNIPLNPTKEETFQVLSNLFTEMASYFPDDYFHTGGDEVVTGCFPNDPQVAAWMKSHGMTNGQQVYAYFESRLNTIMSQIKKKNIVWQDVFDAGISIDKKSTLVEVWSDHAKLADITAAGIKAITSAGWYLVATTKNTWQDFYLNEPILEGMTPAQEALVLGGEACQWAEQVNTNTIDAIAWPRTAAVAERLWSAKSVTDLKSMKQRLDQHSCLLVQRGINSSPIQPGWCPTP